MKIFREIFALPFAIVTIFLYAAMLAFGYLTMQIEGEE